MKPAVGAMESDHLEIPAKNGSQEQSSESGEGPWPRIGGAGCGEQFCKEQYMAQCYLCE